MKFVLIQLACFLMKPIRAELSQQNSAAAAVHHPHILVTFQKVAGLNGDVSYKEVSSKQVISTPTAPSYKYENIRQEKLTNPPKEWQNSNFYKEKQNIVRKKMEANLHVTKHYERGDTHLSSQPSNFLQSLAENLFIKVNSLKRVDDVVNNLTSFSLTDFSSTMLITLAIVAYILYL